MTATPSSASHSRLLHQYFRLLGLSCLMFWQALPAAVDISVNPDAGRKAISPLIYGTNGEIGAPATSWRQGGNRMTGYNWENNASNAGSDYFYQSDDYLTWLFGVTGTPGNAPGLTVTHFHDEVLAKGSLYSIVSLQLAGYVAKDKTGSVSVGETAPSSRWVPVSFTKGSAFTTTPNAADGTVYMDEFINFLVNRYGNAASATGVKGYSLDNEPDLWANTHIRIHPNKVGCAELVARNVEAAQAVRRVDPTAETIGFVSYGFGGYLDLQSAPDWSTERTKGSYRWFIDYYLDQMKKASDTAGGRLLDVIDLHNYSEARGGGLRVNDTSDYTNVACNQARMQAPRSLWDPNYVEESWIGQYYRSFLPFLPNIRQSIETFYPGTKFAMTEYAYGGEGHISGGIAQADVLGIFGQQDVYLANLWPWGDDHTFSAAAFRLYRNFDGAGGQFGSTAVTAASNDVSTCTTYAAIEGGSASRLHVIALNKSYSAPTQLNFTISGATQYGSARVFAFDSASATITERTAVTGITGNQFSYTLPALTAAHFVLEIAAVAPAFTTQPSSQTVVAGNAVTFTAAASGSPTPTLQWQKNSTNISGATGGTYTIANTVPADAGSYTVVATNSVSPVTSTVATLTVNTVPVFTTQPQGANVTTGASVTFTAAASGAPTPTYQWRKDNVDLSGATGASYTIANTAPGDSGSYTVVATNVAGSIASAVALLDVGTPPAGFDVTSYLTRYPAVAAVFGGNTYGAWLYYRNQGIYDGEVFDEVFRVNEYLSLYPDLSLLFGDNLSAALDHWLSTGRIEGKLGRIPQEFSAAGYFTRNSDVATAVGNDPVLAWGHYWLYGIYEGRAYDEELRVFEYLAINADLTAAFVNDWRQAALHWMRYGRTEGRLGRIPLIFDVTEYLNRYPAVQASWGTYPTTVFLHYWLYGIDEGKNFDDLFRVDEYLALNPDLAAVFGTDRRGAFKHWVRYGSAEGRPGRNP